MGLIFVETYILQTGSVLEKVDRLWRYFVIVLVTFLGQFSVDKGKKGTVVRVNAVK